ncbi:MAG: glycoside hydrolase family 130 protein [Armatimonadota bacterium]
MDTFAFEQRLKSLLQREEALLSRKNAVDETWDNGLFLRYKYPVVTNEHVPVHWRFDLNRETNPYLMERMGVNAAFNAGAIEMDGKILMVVRLEGYDRKSFFAVAESDNGIDNFRFWDHPIVMPETDIPDTNVYDMRLTKHQDGWIYGLFCTERPDPDAAPGNTSSAIAQCGIARTRDLKTWERLDDLRTNAPQQRNVVLHPEFVDGKYAFYTRPADGFMVIGSQSGIGWALSESIEHAVIGDEALVDEKVYHTIKEAKNGQGPAPFKTAHGWLHIAHGVRDCAAGMRYVLYAFMTDLQHPEIVTHRPAGYLIAPYEAERVGDVSNVVFCNGAVVRADGEMFIYYASSDTRMHVAHTTLDKMVDYVLHTPEDPLRTYACVQQRIVLIDKNLAVKA